MDILRALSGVVFGMISVSVVVGITLSIAWTMLYAGTWPGMKTPTEQWARDNGRKIAPCIILPMPTENSDE